MLKIIIGPAGSGQSNMLCKEMVESSLAHPSSSFYAIVPEQSTLRMQRDVVQAHPEKAVMNIDVVSFDRLAHRVFQELGINEADILNDTGKVLILRKVLEESRDDLNLYKKKVHMPGFAEEMKSVVTELKQYSINDEDLSSMQKAATEEGNSLLFSKLQDVRLIYNRFNENIAGRYTTQEEILDVFARVVHQSRLMKGASIYMDGFTGFTPVQYKLIEELMKYAENITVSLTLPEEYITANLSEENQFYLSNRTYNRLCEIADRTRTEIIKVNTGESANKPKAYVFHASDIVSEVKFAAKEILHGIRRKGMRFRDYAIVCSDMDAYYDIIKNTFREAGISCFIDYKTELGDNSLARFVVSAMGLITDRFSYDSVFAYLKSGMTSLSLDEINVLENYALEFGIKNYRPWNNDFKKNRKVHNEEYWDLEKINRIRKDVMNSLADFMPKLEEKKKQPLIILRH